MLKGFVPFTAQEIRQHISVYIFHGLSLSPRVENKFRHDHVDEVHGNNFIYNLFGPNVERRRRHLKAIDVVAGISNQCSIEELISSLEG